jgi:hydroxymethylpyrimidine pyrophosphatase-like HAD family hydrolase
VPSRLLATDLDGTLLRSDGRVSPRTRAALDALPTAGIGLVLVTGRPPRWMGPVVDGSGHRGTAVCANGGVILDLASDTVVAVHPIPAADAAAAVDGLRALLPGGVTFAVERARVGGHAAAGGPGFSGTPTGDPTEFAHEPSYRPRYSHTTGAAVAPVEELVGGGDVVKLLARAHVGDRDVDALLAAAHAAVGELVEVTHSSAGDLLLEMSARGVDKAHGLAAVADALGVAPDEVAAVGDMPNDLPMLRWAGASFAVANAHPAVLAAVAEVLPSNDDDGVAALAERLARL